jgi:hypothetical protein
MCSIVVSCNTAINQQNVNHVIIMIIINRTIKRFNSNFIDQNINLIHVTELHVQVRQIGCNEIQNHTKYSK